MVAVSSLVFLYNRRSRIILNLLFMFSALILFTCRHFARHKTLKLKRFFILHSYVFCRCQAVEVENEVEHFLIISIVVERNYRDSIVNLVGEGVHRIVHNHKVFHFSVSDDSEILHVVALRC